MKISISEFKNADNKTLRNFGLIMAFVLSLGFGIIIPKFISHPVNLNFLYLGIGFMLPALIFPKILKPIYIPWMVIGGILGIINSKIILGLIYFLLFTTVAFIMKMFGIDPMNRKFSKNLKSYRILPRDQQSKMENPF